MDKNDRGLQCLYFNEKDKSGQFLHHRQGKKYAQLNLLKSPAINVRFRKSNNLTQ